ncbi:hypothetical protein Patl1_02175 [Pistacia atlantica]|uniref:Uncharacterized protein n=1 Tax=Pistacia atlantica TaxID=434234 RepID=A0ACC1CBM3_9ROSI|nr:hypothetical protein Patl1_02175 [Pistacia atlantica]
MRRRAADFRRPVRRRISNVVWWTLCGIVVLIFIVILSKETKIESRPTFPKKASGNGRNYNF